MNNLLLSIPTFTEPESTGMYIFEMIMFIIIILTSLGMLIGGIHYIYQCIKGDEDFDESYIFPAIFAICFVAGMAWIFGFFTITYNDRKKEYAEWYATEYEEVAYNEIYSLDLQNEVSGHFTLGSGRIGTDNYYYFYIKDYQKDYYQFTKLKYKNDVYIKEVEENPKIIQRKDKDSSFVYYVIYVPVGTVINADYKVV